MKSENRVTMEEEPLDLAQRSPESEDRSRSFDEEIPCEVEIRNQNENSNDTSDIPRYDVEPPSSPSWLSKAGLPLSSPISLLSQENRLSMVPGLFPISSLTQDHDTSSNILARKLVGSPRRQRGEKRPIPDTLKDEKYFERRKRNNLAAKKSRDARKQREDHVAFRATYLERENAILRAQVATLREEAASIRHLLLSKSTLKS